MRKVGVIGLGRMGSAMAEALLNAGHELTVYSRDVRKTEPFTERGAALASTPREVGERVDAAITMVTDTQAVEQVVFGSEGLSEARRGITLIEMSTISPSASLRIAERLEAKGFEMLDAPVMGGPSLAAKGRLLIMVGGKREVVKANEDLLKVLGRDVLYAGGHGAGHALKLAMNLYVAHVCVGFSEALALIRKAGLRPGLLVDAVNASQYKTGVSESKGLKIAGNEFPATFALDLMLKDMNLVVDYAKELGLSLPVGGLTRELYQMASNLGLGEMDHTAIAKMVQIIGGLETA